MRPSKPPEARGKRAGKEDTIAAAAAAAAGGGGKNAAEALNTQIQADLRRSGTVGKAGP